MFYVDSEAVRKKKLNFEFYDAPIRKNILGILSGFKSFPSINFGTLTFEYGGKSFEIFKK
jgi:hypothetical protein